MIARHLGRHLALVIVFSAAAGVGSTALADDATSPNVTKVEPAEGRLGELVALHVDGLKGWTVDRTKLVLFLDGRSMPEVVPTFFEMAKQEVHFKLDRRSGSQASKDAWASILTDPIQFG